MNAKILVPSLLAVAVSANVNAAEFNFAGNGTLNFSGDLELDTDFRSDSDASAQGRDKFEQNGRVLLTFEGEKRFGDNYAKIKAQPLLKVDGELGVDDAFVEFGAENNWAVRAGRYEAIDLFPMGQDTIVDYVNKAGGEDLGVYMYRGSEGRGRANDAGQLMVNKSFGSIYTEVSTLIGNARDFMPSYGNATVSDIQGEYTTIIRPAVQYQGNGWRATAGLEYFLSDQSVNVEGNRVDISDRFGYSTTFGYDLPFGVVNASFAQLKTDEMDATTYGINTVINQWGAGYVYGENSYNGNLSENTDTSVSSLYGSYIVNNLIGLDNMEMHLGMFYSWGEFDGGADDSEVAGRVRLKYLF